MCLLPYINHESHFVSCFDVCFLFSLFGMKRMFLFLFWNLLQICHNLDDLQRVCFFFLHCLLGMWQYQINGNKYFNFSSRYGISFCQLPCLPYWSDLYMYDLSFFCTICMVVIIGCIPSKFMAALPEFNRVNDVVLWKLLPLIGINTCRFISMI